jgi:signal transduction histidine kinase
MASIFIDKSVKPNPRMLSGALGQSYQYWEEIRDTLEAQYGKLNEDWRYYGASSGWILKSLLKKRNLFFLIPGERFFTVAFVFGDKAVRVIEESDLPVRIVNVLKNARRYAEGRGLRIEVKRQSEVKIVLKLVAAKVGN